MEYQDFLEYIKNHIVQVLGQYRHAFGKEDITFDPNEYEVILQKISKNNGIMLDAITLYKEGQKISPNMYVNAYYEQYQMGRPIDGIMQQMIMDYEEKMAEADTLQVDNVYHFEEVRTKIVVRLINRERNQMELMHCPYIPFLDFAITFRYLASKDALGVASSMISNQEFEAWGITMEELYEIAICNTMQHFPWRMDSLAKVIAECLSKDVMKLLSEDVYQAMLEVMNQQCGVNMYVLTNDVGINGATCILYDKVLENFAKVQERNILILPASVHEVILVPEEEDTDAAFFSQLVRDANQSSVGLIDLLSDQVYYYDREKKEILSYPVGS
ncbi:MAG TPA: hypothetical protein DHV96_08975 [Lachnospiraceae bacterium]|nr:hypothetical protein [Lachnospiraceae bacterium]